MGSSISLFNSTWLEVMTANIIKFGDVTLKSLSCNDINMSLGSCSCSRANPKSLLPKNKKCSCDMERSLSFKSWENITEKLDTTEFFDVKSFSDQFGVTHSRNCSPKDLNCVTELISPGPKSELDAAAVKLQKVYKSYRTRRNLADCAVVVEELWWKALDFASLKRSSISFFKDEKPETAVSRWVRARTRAAKVGKGLSKNEKAQKLALQHWLEAIDPRHRYGHNLHLYYDLWFDSESSQPFFYWLDIGDGKEVNIEDCPRTRMHQQCIQYLGPVEREAFEVVVRNGKLMYKQSENFVETVDGSKWIFVLSTSRNLYIGQKKKGKFQHSSFLSGGAITAAGRLVAKDGILQAIWPYSGHYLPTEDNFKDFITFLTDNDIDLANVKRCSVDDDKFPSFKKPNELQISDIAEILINCKTNTTEEENVPMFEFQKRLSCKWSSGIGPRIGCVRDYPADLQSKALEQVNLSPRVNISNYKIPIPSPRPSPTLRLSPRLAYMGIPSPRPNVSLTLPTFKR